jgi:hypothetical protein
MRTPGPLASGLWKTLQEEVPPQTQSSHAFFWAYTVSFPSFDVFVLGLRQATGTLDVSNIQMAYHGTSGPQQLHDSIPLINPLSSIYLSINHLSIYLPTYHLSITSLSLISFSPYRLSIYLPLIGILFFGEH